MKSGRLLLADRHLGMLESVHDFVHDQFDTVMMVADERSLAESVVELRPDLVIVDLSLPRGQEANLAEQLIGRHPGLRLIVLSVHGEASVADGLMAVGVAGFVLKWAAGTDLLPAIRAVLTGGTFVSPTVRSGCEKPPVLPPQPTS